MRKFFKGALLAILIAILLGVIVGTGVYYFWQQGYFQ
jgi:uncharacterized protein HemX